MAGINKVFILGRLGRDPEMKFAQGDGLPVCRFSLAVNEKRNGEEQTEWFNCVAFDKTAKVADAYLGKGSQVHVEGRLQTRKWRDKSGVDRTAMEVIVGCLTLLDSGGKSAETAPGGPRSDEKAGGRGKQGAFGFDGRDARSSRPADEQIFSPVNDDDDIPF